ncbi:MAG: hypothetical protein KIS80_01530 [Anaerolineales bacterium]|nr:hypothetical protein [Anaerolineales bacterium]
MFKLPLATLFLLLTACRPAAFEAGLPPGELQAEANGITVTTGNFRVERLHFVADICFERPSVADWLLGDQTLLTYGTESVRVREMGLLDPTTEIVSPTRCDAVRFPVGTDEIIEFQLVIPFLQTSYPTHDCATAQARLDEAHSGIEISCYSEVLENGGMGGYRIEAKPDNLSDEEANAWIYQAFVDRVDGPWIFEGNVE